MLHSCPYCRCDQVRIERTVEGGVVVCCGSCGMSGPESVDGDESEAVRGWQILCSRMCNHCRRTYIKRLVELRKKLDAKTEAP